MARGFLASLWVIVVAATIGMASPARAQGDENISDEQRFREFQQIVSGFSRQEQISSWEAFILKYPDNRYIPQAKQIIADLKAGRTPHTLRARRAKDSKPARAPKADFVAKDQDTNELDLDWVEGSTERAKSSGDDEFTDDDPFGDGKGFGSDDDGFFQDGDKDPDPGAKLFDSPPPSARNATHGTRASGKTASSQGSKKPSEVERPAQGLARMEERSRRRRRRARAGTHEWVPQKAGWHRAFVWEIAPFAGAAPDEVFVRNTLFGTTAGVHFGRRWFAETELAVALASQTQELLRLKSIDAQPEVLMGYRFMTGVGGGYKLFMAPNNFKSGGHDLFLRAGTGLVYADVEVCRENSEGIKCAQPQVVSGWFPYFTAGAGYRFYFNPWVGLRADLRYRGLFEIVDTEATFRGNIQVTGGLSFSF